MLGKLKKKMLPRHLESKIKQQQGPPGVKNKMSMISYLYTESFLSMRLF